MVDINNDIYYFMLPTPPSVNRLWRISGKRMHKSKVYVDWLADCHHSLRGIYRPNIDYAFNIEIIVGRPSKRRMDIDNRAKAVMDALQELRIIADDCLANRVTMMWSLEIEWCEITITRAEVH
mgnify:FL=1